MEDKDAYRIPLALFFIAPTVQSISLIFFPESPRWLMAHGREESAALALRRLRGKTIEEISFQAELNEIRISTRQQVEHSKLKKKQLWLEIWNASNRRRTLLSIAVVCFHCAAGGHLSNFSSSHCFTAPPCALDTRSLLDRVILPDNIHDLFPHDGWHPGRPLVRVLRHDNLHGPARDPLQLLLGRQGGPTSHFHGWGCCLRAHAVGFCRGLDRGSRHRDRWQSGGRPHRSVHFLLHCLR